MSISSRDSKYIWHPYTQAGSSGKTIAIVKGEGAAVHDEKGKRYIDAVSSWWTNLHGHSHPHIAKKIAEQATKLEHILFAGFTHEPAVSLAERLLKILPAGQERIFYSDNGSTAVEVALKMAFQYWSNKGEKRDKVIAFRNAYHGDTFGAMSVSGRGAFTKPFHDLLFDVFFIDAPVTGNVNDPISEVKGQISEHGSGISSFIFEPLVQGTAGMQIHTADLLSEMITLCKKNGILTIADEVMTGFGRTGKMFASELLSVQPDIICLSKGITGGAMPLGVTSCTKSIFDAFLSGDKMKTFFHGHSYTANPLACAAANASLDIFENENVFERIEMITKCQSVFASILRGNAKIAAVRNLGTILAFDLATPGGSSYFSPIRDRAYDFFIERGIILRPLGNTIYVMPPYCITESDLNYIYEQISEFLLIC